MAKLEEDSDLIWYSATVPVDFPTRNEIVDSCTKAGIHKNSVCILLAGNPRFRVKYGRDSLIRCEGRTQAYVAGIVNANSTSVVRIPNIYLGFSRGYYEYIVMDFVEGTTFAQRRSPEGYYTKKDVKAVTAAMKQLIDIRIPQSCPPGPVNGGYITHDFFVECLSALVYPTVGSLETHINEVLRLSGNALRVNFQNEVVDGLVLCLPYPNDSDFMIDNEGQIWAVDFGSACFLPPSFVSYTLKSVTNTFGRSVAHCLNYPTTINFPAMVAASLRLVWYGDKARKALDK